MTRLIVLVVMVVKTGDRFKDLLLTGDSFSYYHLAFNLKYFFSLTILDTPFFSDALLRTPGYPLFVSGIFNLFNNNLVALLSIQALLSGLTAVLIYRISNLIKLPSFVGLGAAMLFAVEPTIALFSNAVITETLFLFLMLLFFYLLFSGKTTKRHYLLLGIIFGFNILVRPVMYPYLSIISALIGLYIWKNLGYNFRKVFVSLLLFIVGVYIMVFPWIMRNKIAFDSWKVSSISGVHLYYSYAVPFYAYLNGIKKDDAVKEIDIDIIGDKYDLRNDKIYKIVRNKIKSSMLLFFNIPRKAPNIIVKFINNHARAPTTKVRKYILCSLKKPRRDPALPVMRRRIKLWAIGGFISSKPKSLGILR